MNFNTLRFKEPDTGIGLVTLNRPDRLNAMSMEMVNELHSLFAQLKTESQVRVIILTGEGRGFCSGADLKDVLSRGDLRTLFPDATAHLIGIQKKYTDLVLEMRRLPQPIVAAVNGPAAGGGMCLALASDIVLASPQAAFTPSCVPGMAQSLWGGSPHARFSRSRRQGEGQGRHREVRSGGSPIQRRGATNRNRI